MDSHNSKDYIDPDLMDALADSDVASHIAERLLKALDTRVKKGTDITELEGLLIERLKSDKRLANSLLKIKAKTMKNWQ